MDVRPRPSLLLALLLVVATRSFAQQRRTLSPLCTNAPPDFNLRLYGRTFAIQCPCLFSGAVSASARGGTVNVSIYALPADDFAEWREAFVRRGTSSVALPSSESAIVIQNSLDENSRTSTTGRRVWQSRTTAINDTGPFNLLMFLNVDRNAPCVNVGMTLEPKPDACPLRLAGPPDKDESDESNDLNDSDDSNDSSDPDDSNGSNDSDGSNFPGDSDDASDADEVSSSAVTARRGTVPDDTVELEKSAVAIRRRMGTSSTDLTPSFPKLTARQKVAAYVVGGTPVGPRDEFTAYNALVSSRLGNCTASLIADDWLLTAAHCRMTPGSLALIGGRDHASGVRRLIKSVITHPGFRQDPPPAQTIVNDVSLLKLDEPVPGGIPIALNDNEDGPVPGTIARATGFGRRTTRTLGTTRFLLMVDNTVLSANECASRYIRGGGPSIARGLDDQVHLCAGRDDECDSGGICFGDSGGPIVARTRSGRLVQVGVSSFGAPLCAQKGLPDVFVRVSEMLPWIRRVVGEKITTVTWETVNNTAARSESEGLGGSGELPRQGGRSFSTSASVAMVLVAIAAIALVAGLVAALIVRARRTRSSGASQDGSTHAVAVVDEDDTSSLPPEYAPPPEWVPPPPPISPQDQPTASHGLGPRPAQ